MVPLASVTPWVLRLQGSYVSHHVICGNWWRERPDRPKLDFKFRAFQQRFSHFQLYSLCTAV